MATVVFSTIGQAVGGPLGAALGMAAGGMADQALFGRRKSRATDLFIQRSSYGDVIPRLFGTTRQAGVLIWAQPMAKSGGKGSGAAAYVMSFAIALSSAPIKKIGRIWADGREIRNADEEFAFPIQMRVYQGEQRAPDPLIVATEGLDGAPAYAGLSYAVFEDFPLGEFGNRIPTLSFEVMADERGVSFWLTDLAPSIETEVSDDGLVIGFGASSDRVLDDAEQLVHASDLQEVYDGRGLGFRSEVPVHYLSEDDLIPDEHGARVECGSYLGAKPSGYEIGYIDPERDYQAGVQAVVRNRPGRRVEDYSTLVLSASNARLLASHKLAQMENFSETLEVQLPWRWLHIGVGHLLDLGDHLGMWRVERKIVDGVGVKLSAIQHRTASKMVFAGDGGRALAAPVELAGPTKVKLVESRVPIFGEDKGPWLVADGSGAWRGADIWIDAGDGERFAGKISTASPMGKLEEVLPASVTTTWDETSVLIVRFESEVLLQSRSKEAVLSGANLLLVGREFIQFRDAEPLDDFSYRLTGLLRGRLATEYETLEHATGTEVVVLERDGMLLLPIGRDLAGREIALRAVGPGDPAGGTFSNTIYEELGHEFLAPAHPRVTRDGEGGLLITWVPRSASGWPWGESVADQVLTIRFHHHEQGLVQRRANAGKYRYILDDQLDDFGATFSGQIAIIADGAGPEAARCRLIEIE